MRDTYVSCIIARLPMRPFPFLIFFYFLRDPFFKWNEVETVQLAREVFYTGGGGTVKVSRIIVSFRPRSDLSVSLPFAFTTSRPVAYPFPGRTECLRSNAQHSAYKWYNRGESKYGSNAMSVRAARGVISLGKWLWAIKEITFSDRRRRRVSHCTHTHTPQVLRCPHSIRRSRFFSFFFLYGKVKKIKKKYSAQRDSPIGKRALVTSRRVVRL